MARFLSIPLFAALLLLAGGAGAQSGDEEWVSYRDAYRAMLSFEKFGKPKHFLQIHYQVMAREKGSAAEGLSLSLNTKAAHLNLPLDATGRTVFPLSKAAYDENATLVLNRKLSQFVFRPRVSIQTRADGIYELADLRAACDEAYVYQQFAEPAAVRGKKCVGVRFSYARGSSAALRYKDKVLTIGEGAAFQDDPNEAFRVVNVRFAELPDKGQLTSAAAPVAIAALYE